MSRKGRKCRGSMVNRSMGYFTYFMGDELGLSYHPLILSIDPNFQRNLQLVITVATATCFFFKLFTMHFACKKLDEHQAPLEIPYNEILREFREPPSSAWLYGQLSPFQGANAAAAATRATRATSCTSTSSDECWEPQDWTWTIFNSPKTTPNFPSQTLLDGGFKYFLFSPLPGEDSHFD